MKLASVILIMTIAFGAYGADIPTYDDVKATIDGAIKAIDDKDADAIFSLVAPADLEKAKKDSEQFESAKVEFFKEKAAALKAILVTLKDITPEYDEKSDTLSFKGESLGTIKFVRDGDKWYLKNH